MELSEGELELVHKFRTLVTDFVPKEKLQDDYFLIRWLRARDMDMEKAKHMLLKSMEWVKKNKMDSILNWKPETNYYRYAMAGHDYQGCPVFILPVGFWKANELTHKDEVNFLHRLFLRFYARIEQEIKLSSQRLGKPVTQTIVILDYDHFSYLGHISNRTMIPVALNVAREFEANLPEVLKTAISINTARLFSVFFTLFKPFMSAKTINKVEIYGSKRQSWIKALEARIPMEILPPHYGGTRPGNDEYCSNDTTLWNDGEPLPDNFYQGIRMNNFTTPRLSSSEVIDQLDTNLNYDSIWTKQEIRARSQLDLEFIVTKDLLVSSWQPILNWEIKSEGYDIGMKVTLRQHGGETAIDVLEYSRIDCHLTPSTGSFPCQEPGVYTLVLDNSYSLRRSKNVLYKIELIENEIIR